MQDTGGGTEGMKQSLAYLRMTAACCHLCCASSQVHTYPFLSWEHDTMRLVTGDQSSAEITRSCCASTCARTQVSVSQLSYMWISVLFGHMASSDALYYM
jgi:hypothetical protein